MSYYLPHYLLQQLLEYLQNDPMREHPTWGWFFSFSLFMSNAIVFVITGVIYSLSTTTLQGRIKLQLNTMLFSKTLRKKDVAGMGDDTGREAGDKKDVEAAESKDDDKDEEGVASKAQIMVSRGVLFIPVCCVSNYQTLFTVDVDRVTDFVWHAFALIDAPIEIAV